MNIFKTIRYRVYFKPSVEQISLEFAAYKLYEIINNLCHIVKNQVESL